MPIINSLISWFMKQRMHQIELFLKYPCELQDNWLKQLLFVASHTEWGEKYDYSSINSFEEYCNRVPIQDYESLQPWIERLRKGENNLLWPSEVKWFAKSSGTTGSKSKFIPVTEEALEECHMKGGKDMLSFYCNNNPDTLIFDGKSLGLGGSYHLTEVDTEIYYGDLSAILIQNLPFWAEFIRTPNISIALMDEWEEKIEKMAEATRHDYVTNMMGVPSWTLLLLRRILELEQKSNLAEVWPGLELYVHGGINFAPYREQFKAICPPGMKFLETYNASEGFFGIQDRNDADDMLLMLDYGVYYEFLPVKNLADANPKTITLSQVEIGVNYALIISSNAGLWRYLIGDTIMFTSLGPHRIKITGRTRSFINAFGEELIMDNSEKAIAIACEKSGSIVSEYTAAPLFYDNEPGRGTHQWLIEFSKAPENPDFFAEVLDNALKSLNSDYEAKRYHNLVLDKPEIINVPEGTFYQWMKIRGKLGGQNKVPRLANNREYVEQILQLIKTGL